MKLSRRRLPPRKLLPRKLPSKHRFFSNEGLPPERQLLFRLILSCHAPALTSRQGAETA